MKTCNIYVQVYFHERQQVALIKNKQGWNLYTSCNTCQCWLQVEVHVGVDVLSLANPHYYQLNNDTPNGIHIASCYKFQIKDLCYTFLYFADYKFAWIDRMCHLKTPYHDMRKGRHIIIYYCELVLLQLFCCIL